MKEYVHGGDIYSQEIELDFSANINPFGLPEGVKKRIIEKINTFSRYPDSQSRVLRERLGEIWKVNPKSVICGNGAADLVFQLAAALKPENALLAAPSFAEYEQALKAQGCKIQYLKLEEKEEFHLNWRQWASKLEKGCQIAFLCNPNNPTGLTVPAEQIKEMARICRERKILLVVDECFNGFLDDPKKNSVISLTENNPWIFVLRAFTKIYGMAGIRLGYGICANHKLLDQMEAIRQPWSVSGVAEEVGLAALEEKEYIEASRKLIKEEREFLKIRLKALGWKVWDSQANYLFFQVPEDQDELGKKLKEKKVLIRSCSNYYGLGPGYYRICVKTRRENEQLLKAVEEIL